MSKKSQITKNILSKLDTMSGNLDSDKTEVVEEIQSVVNDYWRAYLDAKSEFTDKKAAADLEKREEVTALEEQLDAMKIKIAAVGTEVGSLTESFAKKHDIVTQLPNIDTSVEEEIAFVSNQLKRLNGEPFDLASDVEFDAEIALIKELYAQYEIQCGIFRKHVTDYKKAYGEDSFGNSDIGDWAERQGIQELGKIVTGLLGEMSERIHTVHSYSKELSDDDAKLMDNIIVVNQNFTKEFYDEMRGGIKSNIFTPPADKVADEAAAAQYIKDLNISTEGILTESSKLGRGLFDTIMKQNATYNKALSKGLDKVNLEEVRNLLFSLKANCAVWLNKHKDAKPDSKQEIQGNQIKEVQLLLGKHITIIGSLAVNKDNFIEITTRYEAEFATVVQLEELMLAPPKGVTSEDLQLRVDALKAKIKTGIEDCAALGKEWLAKHNDGSFGNKKKDNTLNDLARTLAMRAYKVLDGDVPKTDYTPEKPYDATKDKALNRIQKMVVTSKGEQKNTDYKKRFKLLGDLNNAIQKWEFKNKYYEGKKIKVSRDEITTCKDFLNTEYGVVNAQMSMKGLEAGYSEHLEKYEKWVIKYNSSEAKDKETREKDFPKIIEGSNAIIEFINTWNEQYTKLKKSGVPIPNETETRLIELEKRYEKTKKVIEDNNFSVLTGMVDVELESKAGDMKKEAEVKEAALQTKKTDQVALETKIKQLEFDITKLKLDIDNATENAKEDAFREALDKKQEELEKLTDEFAYFVMEVEGMQTKVDNLKLQASQLEARLEKQKKGGPTVLYLSIVKDYEDGKTAESFDYKDDLDLATENQRRHFINELMANMTLWDKEVVDPTLEYLEPYVRTLTSIRADLKSQMKQFNEKRTYVDTNYNNIKNSYEAIKKAVTVKDISVEALQELTFCRKLIGYWYKENAVKTDRNKEKRKELNVIRLFVISQIESTRFLALKEAADAETAKENFERLLEENNIALQDRMKTFFSTDIYDSNSLDIGKELTESEKGLNYLFRKANKGIATEVANFITAKDYKAAINEIAKLENDFVANYKKEQIKLHEALVAKEKIVFVGVSELTFDLNSSSQFSEEEKAVIEKTLANITERASAILRAGGTAEEAEKMFEHIPVSVWPDEFISELQAFRSVESALEEEARQGAQLEVEEEHEKLGISNLLKDVGKMGAESVQLLGDKLSEINGLLWHDEVNDTGDGYDTLSVGGEEQKAALKEFMNGVDLGVLGIDLALTSIDFADKTAEQIAALKMERAQAFLFEGKVNFNEDGTGEFETDPAKNTVAQKKRVIILMGMKFAAETSQKVLGAISDTADVYNNTAGDSNGLIAITKDIAAVFEALAMVVEIVSEDNLPRTTQEAWDKNFDRVTKITKGILGAGVTVAETVKIFQVIPMEVLPGLGLAVGAVNLTVDVYAIAKTIVKLSHTSELLGEAKIHDRAYVGPLEQEMTSLKRKAAKQAVDIAADGVAISGGIAVLSGVGAPAGAAISLVAGVMKIGNSLVFQAIDEAQMKHARDLLKKARGGDREAQLEIMAESPIYAKMFIAIGATAEPPNPIALEFVRQRGLTERDLKDDATNKWVIRKFVRTQLLETSGEVDSHDGKLGAIQKLIKRIQAWYARSNKKDGFWNGKVDQSFKLLTELYSIKQLEEMVLDFTEHIDELRDNESESVKKFLGISAAFSTESEEVKEALENNEDVLKTTIEADKTSKDTDFSIKIQQLERDIKGLSLQKEALDNILDILRAVDNLV